MRPCDDVGHELAGLGRVEADRDTRRPEGVHLALGGALAAGDDGAGVAHLLAWRGGDAGHVGDHGLVHLGPDELGRLFFGGATDLAEHDHGLGLGVGLERLEAVDERGAGHGVAADARRRS